MKVLVTGGRAYMNRALVWETLDGLKPDEVWHGGATGADSHADSWARWRAVKRRVFPYERSAGKAGGPIRNQRMIDELPDLVVAFPGGKGTADCMQRATKAGIPLMQVEDAP